MEAAYQQLSGSGFFTLQYHTPDEYPTEEDMYQAVWDGKFWGAIATMPGASDRLEAAIQGVNASTYNANDALHYIWNEQYYTTFARSVVLSGMTKLVAGTRLAYDKINGTGAAQMLNSQDPAAVQVLLNPISSTATNIKPSPFGSVIFFNTVSMAMAILQQFFFLLVINGAMRAHQLYNRMTVRSSLLVRRFAGLTFALGAALCQTGYFWAFREDWHVNGNQFVLTWMTIWLLMHIHYLILDSISSIAPLPVMPFVVVLWILINIAASVSPLELQAGFYSWGIALPSHNAYSVMVTIWSGGANNRLYRALPILFAWWIVANITTILTHVRACHLAYKMEMAQAEDGKLAPKDEEAGIQGESVSRQTTMNRTETNMQRVRSAEEMAMEQRQVYGPGIPPFA
jgi:hypothetical protein